MRVMAVTLLLLFVSVFPNRPAASAKEGPAVTPLAVHAHRYQDFERNAVACEVFGEIKNTGAQPVKSFTLHLEMLDRQGKIIADEDLTLPLRVIVSGNARGELRAVKPQEIGNFIQDTRNCPAQWMEGRIKYRIKEVQTE